MGYQKSRFCSFQDSFWNVWMNIVALQNIHRWKICMPGWRVFQVLRWLSWKFLSTFPRRCHPLPYCNIISFRLLDFYFQIYFKEMLNKQFAILNTIPWVSIVEVHRYWHESQAKDAMRRCPVYRSVVFSPIYSIPVTHQQVAELKKYQKCCMPKPWLDNFETMIQNQNIYHNTNKAMTDAFQPKAPISYT